MKTKHRMVRPLIAGGLFLLLAFALASHATAQSTARIAFHATGKIWQGKPVSGYQIFSMNPDGSGLAQLTKVSANLNPAWSPAQSYIAFMRTANYPADGTLYVMEAKGEANGGRSFAVAQGAEPDWSPDGTMIVFRRQVQNPDGTHQQDIYLVTVDVATGAVGTPAPLAVTPFSEYRPTWSPDGSKIAFARTLCLPDNCGTAIFVRDLATGNEIQLPFAVQGFNIDPEWSPDGTRIAFADANSQISVVNADGSNLPQRLTNLSGGTRFPTWSPDGTAIAFPYGGIVKMDLATGVMTKLSSIGSNPDWSP